MVIAVPAVIAAAGAWAAGASLAAIAFSFFSTLAMSFLQQAMAPKPKRASVTTQDRMITVTQAIGARPLAFGITRMGGTRTFAHSTGDGNGHLHLIITLTGHRTRRLVALVLADEEVPLDEDGWATGRYAARVRAVYGNGTTAGDVDFHAALQDECADKWTANHRQTGCSKIYVQLLYDTQVFPNGIPNVSVIVEAYDNILDPRTETTGFTNNPALCIAHYLQLPEVQSGLAFAAAEIDDDTLIQAANDCDEIVDRVPRQTNFTVNVDRNLIVPADATARLRLGTRVQVAAVTTLPAGLSADTDYFWVPAGTASGQLATSLVNARAGTVIVLEDDGEGTLSIQATGEPRYTLDGVFGSEEDPQQIIGRLLTAMAGSIVQSGGKWLIFAGTYRAPAVSFDISHLDGGISTRVLRSGTELRNGIKGVFANTDDLFQQTDYPPVRNPDYVAFDGDEETFLDLELPFTNSPSMAQRIAKITLEKLRRQVQTTWPLNLSGLQVRPLDTVGLTRSTVGWDEKAFEVSTVTFEPRGDAEQPRLGVTLQMVETDALVYAWDPDTEERELSEAAYTDLPDPFDVAPPTDLFLFPEVLASIIYLRAEWTAADDAFVVDYEVEFRLSPTGSPPDDPEWIALGPTGGELEKLVGPLTTATLYDVRVRAVNNRGVFSDYATVSGYPSDGDTVAPAAPSGVAAAPGNNSATVTGTAPADVDTGFYRVFYNEVDDSGTSSQFGGDTAVAPSGAISAPVTGLANGTPYYFWLKAVDVYGNVSAFSTPSATATPSGGGDGGDGDGG